jgi:hypothetical protein
MIIDEKKGLGFNIDADVVFDESHGQVHQVLTQFLGISDPTLHLSCALGVLQDWHEPLSLTSFELEGVFKDPKPKPVIQTMTIINVGVRLTGSHSVVYGADGGISQGKIYSYSVFGELNFDFLPMPVSFEISDCGDFISLTLALDGEWTHAFGIPLLTVSF